MIDSREKPIQCNNCGICYHMTCARFFELRQLLANKAVTWVCLKCGNTYSQCLVHELGIPTDDLICEMIVEESCTDNELSSKSSGSNTCKKDGTGLRTQKMSVEEEIVI